jgi:hypothetical protein
VPAAAACVKHPAGHAIINIILLIYHLVPAAAACVRYSADDAGHCYLYSQVLLSHSFYII